MNKPSLTPADVLAELKAKKEAMPDRFFILSIMMTDGRVFKIKRIDKSPTDVMYQLFQHRSALTEELYDEPGRYVYIPKENVLYIEIDE